ncbi:porin family protein [Hyphomicrobium methylovorum]|uniref:outer membrane protein n=1 Tax=Hyphomicrobium methylovorum TaxID=84 RepID=UPI0015E7907C|nr:outer membrane beta-barrel protein [Hyphomicrobium methylovorum]MBA2127078.1 porin family protein [Hyphomicrobium methylovorum]
MFKRKLVLLSAAFLLGGAVVATAADLGGGIQDAPEMAPMPAASAGWYVRVDGGYNWYTNPDIDVLGFTTHGNKMDGTWTVGGGIGRYFGRGFRGDITVDYLFDNGTETTLCNCEGTFGQAKFDFSSTVLLANLYYDFNRGGRFVPYIGAGIGFAHNRASAGIVDTECGCDYDIAKGSSNSFAAAAMAGVSWKLRGGETRYIGGMKDEPVAVSSGNALYLDVGYRFLYLGDVSGGLIEYASTEAHVRDVTAHQLRIGLRYDLN